MIRRPPRSTRLTHSFPTRRSSDLLISPFVGRIYDWHKKAAGAKWDEAANAGATDPGVLSVKRIYAYYKAYDIPTEIMGASFRNIGQIRALPGCDLDRKRVV